MAGISKISAPTTLLAATLFLLSSTTSAQTIPNLNATAIRVPETGAWEGNDGAWATFFIRVGTPSQIARVLPATNWQEIFVISSDACAGIDPEDCADLRGLTITPNRSSTWFDLGYFKTDISKDIGLSGDGNYGLDRVGLTNQDSGPTLANQTIVSIDNDNWYVGLLGLGDQPTNFSDFNNPQPSFLTSLYNAGYIPSKSWGYQAGCITRGKSSKGSLTFGGYDTAMYIDNDLKFTLSNDYVHPFQVALRGLTVSGIWLNGVQGTAQLLDETLLRASEPEFISIDSNTPYMWLPNATCAIFESALNITYDERTGLYLLSESQHNQLLDLNPTFKFVISDGRTNDTSLEIEIPYTTFSMEAKGPEILGLNTRSWFFPLKRLPEDANPRLGRAFMQEVYLFAEYHFNTFRLYQADFSGKSGELVTHLPFEEVETKEENDDGPPIAAIVGGVVGGVAVIAAIGGFLFWRRRQKKKSEPGSGIPEVDGTSKKTHELGEGKPWGAGAMAPNTEQKSVVQVEGLHEVHGASREGVWAEADGKAIDNRFEKEGSSPYAQSPYAQSPYSELGGDEQQRYSELYTPQDGISPAAQELPAETRREGR